MAQGSQPTALVAELLELADPVSKLAQPVDHVQLLLRQARPGQVIGPTSSRNPVHCWQKSLKSRISRSSILLPWAYASCVRCILPRLLAGASSASIQFLTDCKPTSSILFPVIHSP
jgi:hypothetical protein